MVLLDVFRQGDVYLDDPYEGIKYRFEKATGNVFARFYGREEHQIEHSSRLYHDAISSGRVITREEYFRD